MLRISNTMHYPNSALLAFANPNEQISLLPSNQIIDFGMFELGATIYTILNGRFFGGDANSTWRIRVGDIPGVVGGEIVLEQIIDSSAYFYFAPASFTGSFVNTYTGPKWVQTTHQTLTNQTVTETNMTFYTL